MNRLQFLNAQFDANTTAYAELSHVPEAPADPILSLSTGYKNDKHP